MPDFLYIARDTSGSEQTGFAQSESASDLALSLRARGWLVMEVRQTDADSDSPSSWSLRNLLPATSLDVELSLRQIALMLESGITLLSALSTAAEQARRPRMGRVWSAVRDRVEQGSTFADALAEHPRIIPPLVVRLAHTGEQTGTLDVVLNRSADQLERSRALRTTLLSALMYPTFVLLAAFGVTTLMAVLVIPELEQALTQLGRELPPITQALLDASHLINDNGPTLSIGFGFALLLLAASKRHPTTAMWVDAIALRLPIFGKLLRTAGTARLARGLALLLENGVTLLEALRSAEGLMLNTVLAKRVAHARDRVLGGGTLASALARTEFSPMLAKMIGVGERTGNLGPLLEKTAVFHEEQLRGAVRRLSALVEPVITLVVGGIVGFVYIAFFLAMYAFAGGGAPAGGE